MLFAAYCSYMATMNPLKNQPRDNEEEVLAAVSSHLSLVL